MTITLKQSKEALRDFFPISEDQKQTSYDNIQDPCYVEFLIIAGKSLPQVQKNNCKEVSPLFL